MLLFCPAVAYKLPVSVTSSLHYLLLNSLSISLLYSVSTLSASLSGLYHSNVYISSLSSTSNSLTSVCLLFSPFSYNLCYLKSMSLCYISPFSPWHHVCAPPLCLSDFILTTLHSIFFSWFLSSPHLDSVVPLCPLSPARPSHRPSFLCLPSQHVLYLLIAPSILFKSRPFGKLFRKLRFHFDRMTGQHRTTFMLSVLKFLSSAWL